MNANDFLSRTGGLAPMARELGITQQQAATGASALLPAIMGGFRRQARTAPGGATGLLGLLGQLGGGGLMDDVVSPRPTPVDRGNSVLGQIFGSKDVSRAVASDASARTGLDTTLLKKMLPMLAMLAAGYMARQGQSGGAASGMGGGLAGALGGLMGGQSGGAGTAGGLAALAGLLDEDGDGNPLDDILGRLGR
ncbi:DUF937 domain-containing protein [Lysobacter sp. A3-1-A15]|uniref:DUF937 domain-containing protein n=1 Tax=Novilysobacter viscosus TaxID=3098602 RepID=UPI002EDB4F8C